MIRSLAILIVILPTCSAAAADPVTIPLKDIWGYRMPGTRDINELGSPRAEDSLVQKVLRQIRDSWQQEHGMAVQGEGKDALKTFYRIRVEESKRNEVFADSPVSLAFFTKPGAWYVRLLEVSRERNRVTIRYRFEPHETKDATQHFALIPLGKLPSAKYAVTVQRSPMEKKFLDLGFSEPPPQQINNVCGSFEFIVVNRRQK